MKYINYKDSLYSLNSLDYIKILLEEFKTITFNIKNDDLYSTIAEFDFYDCQGELLKYELELEIDEDITETEYKNFRYDYLDDIKELLKYKFFEFIENKDSKIFHIEREFKEIVLMDYYLRYEEIKEDEEIEESEI